MVFGRKGHKVSYTHFRESRFNLRFCTYFARLSMGHIYLSHSHPIAIYAHPISSHPRDVSHGIPIGMTFPWTSLGLSMGHIYLSHSHPIP